MAERCLACTRPTDADVEMHPACSRALFGVARVPTNEIDPGHLYLFGQEMAGRTTLSGVQQKVSLGWHQKSLRVRATTSAFILKPQSSTYPELPQNEHACLRIARLCGIDVAENGLVRLRDGSLALVVRRFDRDDDRRLPMEDFAQLSGKLPREKYDGSAELCSRVVRSYSSEPGVDQQRLFRRILVSWWIGNGDLHLKNLSLLTQTRGAPRLSPAYDLLSTRLVIANDPLALPVQGKRSNLDRADWLSFATYCGLPVRQAESELERLIAVTEDVRTFVADSFLGTEFKAALLDVLAASSARL